MLLQVLQKNIFHTGLNCGDFPGPGVSHHKTIATFNPIKEFIHNEDRHITTNFDEFINAHNKKYEHEREHHQRLNVFRNNFRFIHSKNRKGLSYRLAINHLADRTEEEIRVTSISSQLLKLLHCSLLQFCQFSTIYDSICVVLLQVKIVVHAWKAFLNDKPLQSDIYLDLQF